MKTRLLPPNEWPKLAGTLLETVWPNLDTRTMVIVVEDGGEIVGCVAMFPAWHLEGAWVAPERRGRVSVGRRLVRAIRGWAQSCGVRELLMMATTPESSRMVQRFGGVAVKLDCEHFAVTMEDR